MISCKIDFDLLPWDYPAPGSRSKRHLDGPRQIRVVELTDEFVELHWCELGHTGVVLLGELEIDFQGQKVRYPEGSVLLIPPGPDTAHKAYSVTPLVRLFLIEDV